MQERRKTPDEMKRRDGSRGRGCVLVRCRDVVVAFDAPTRFCFFPLSVCCSGVLIWCGVLLCAAHARAHVDALDLDHVVVVVARDRAPTPAAVIDVAVTVTVTATVTEIVTVTAIVTEVARVAVAAAAAVAAGGVATRRHLDAAAAAA